MKPLKHWQDAANAVLGAWLILSPWALGFTAETVAMGNAVVVGAVLLAAALGAIFVPRAWEEWTEGVLGLWLIASPWTLRFSAHEAARLDAVAAGAVIVVLALWTLMVDKDYGARWRKRKAIR